jgi:hypothetical protein
MLRSLGLVLLTLLLTFNASADTVESVMMPGKVIQGHAKWEDDCQKCHKPFDKAAQSQLCKDCHKETAKDVVQKKGLHGRLKEGRNCAECHTEHKGRAAQIAPINEKTFKHEQTDFELKGAHADVKKTDCKDCHKPKIKYREAPTACNACHKKDDKHEGTLGASCENCHSVKDWKDTKDTFDHNKTKFALEGKHADVKCNDCHLTKKYRDAPKDCYSCHKKDDAHKGVFGTKCVDCHTAKDWKESTFDHGRDTKYALRGKHKTAKCESCHKPSAASLKLPTACISCHKKDDKHEGTLGDNCEKCHSEKSWTSTPGFDHDDTKFPLLGKHKTAKCQTCHINGTKEKLPLLCNDCHQKEDKHKGNFGTKCESCHTEKDWKNASKFNHDRDTKYVLRDKHKTTKCEACHTGKLYGQNLKTDCYSCHKKDDKHKGQEGTKCEDCHNEKSWTKAEFDHSKSKFPLLGKHYKVECKKCHLTPAFKDAKSECVSCHEKDDAHKLRLGTQCETCHNARDWKVWDFDHDKKTKFKLDGGHKGIDCYECHKTPSKGNKLATPALCGDCHASDDIHDGGFGRQCERCHVSSTWSELKMGARFSR